MKEHVKKSIYIASAAAVAAGGAALINYDRPEPLTLEEYQTVVELINYEVERANGKIDIQVMENETQQEALFRYISSRKLDRGEVPKLGGIATSTEKYNELRKNIYEKVKSRK